MVYIHSQLIWLKEIYTVEAAIKIAVRSSIILSELHYYWDFGFTAVKSPSCLAGIVIVIMNLALTVDYVYAKVMAVETRS